MLRVTIGGFMAGGRPKKAVTKQMVQASESLEEVEHVSDLCHELFHQLGAVNDKQNPDEYARIEALYEEEWDRSIKMVKVHAPVFEKLKALTHDLSNGLSDADRDHLKVMAQNCMKEEPRFFSEADWISRLAHKYAFEILLAHYQKEQFVKHIYTDLAQESVMAILTAGTYEYMHPKQAKAGYIKQTVRAKVSSFLKELNQTKLKTNALRAVLIYDIASESGNFDDLDTVPDVQKKTY